LHANNHYKNIIYMNTIHKNSGTWSKDQS
jgi:hypothetical protein